MRRLQLIYVKEEFDGGVAVKSGQRLDSPHLLYGQARAVGRTLRLLGGPPKKGAA